MLLFADQFLSIYKHARAVWITGLYGRNKTSFAYALAEPYLKRGYRLVSNNHSVWRDEMNSIEFDKDGKLNVVVLLDEAGVDIKFRSQAGKMLAYLRKMDVYICMPSFWPPAQMLRFLVLQPIINWQMIGLPLITYRWTVRLKMFEAAGWFLWWNPQEIYGIYSSMDPGEDAQAILDWLTKKAEEYRQRFGYSLSAEDEISSMGFGESINEAAEEIADAAEALSFSVGKASKRTRR